MGRWLGSVASCKPLVATCLQVFPLGSVPGFEDYVKGGEIGGSRGESTILWRDVAEAKGTEMLRKGVEWRVGSREYGCE